MFGVGSASYMYVGSEVWGIGDNFTLPSAGRHCLAAIVFWYLVCLSAATEVSDAGAQGLIALRQR